MNLKLWLLAGVWSASSLLVAQANENYYLSGNRPTAALVSGSLPEDSQFFSKYEVKGRAENKSLRDLDRVVWMLETTRSRIDSTIDLPSFRKWADAHHVDYKNFDSAQVSKLLADYKNEDALFTVSDAEYANQNIVPRLTHYGLSLERSRLNDPKLARVILALLHAGYAKKGLGEKIGEGADHALGWTLEKVSGAVTTVFSPSIGR